MELETCIDQQDLKKFALGHLDEARSNAIAAHLSNCPQCEETMVGFDDTDDSMLAGVREAAAGDLSEAADSPAEAVLVCIPNPWGEPDDNRKPASTGEWVRDYELLEPLGRGGMGTVYKAVHTRLQRPVAIKLLPSRRLRDPDAVARFEREMRAIGRLDHPAIVRATDAGEADGTHFLVMDYVEGIDLSQLMKVTGPMDVASACEVIRQIAIALQYAHDQGLIHRDVKPSNLMVEAVVQERQGSFTCENAVLVKLLDLGLALFGAASEAVDELTTVGQLMGTLDYMAPEQADNSHNVDARADVYSLGATMFKLLTGTAPYETSQRRTPLQKMKALATIDAPSIKTRQPALQDDVVSIVDRMLVRDPASRFQTAAEVALAVTPFCRGHRLVELTHHAMQSSHHAPRDEPSARPADSKTPGRLKGLPAAAAALSPAGADRKVLQELALRGHLGSSSRGA
jgi:serine/threonine protein kinase